MKATRSSFTSTQATVSTFAYASELASNCTIQSDGSVLVSSKASPLFGENMITS